MGRAGKPIRPADWAKARFGWALVFGLLLSLMVAAVPVLADPSFQLPPDPSQLNGSEVDRPPTGAEVGEALLAAQKGEEAEQLARETPQAEAERKASQTAYVDMGANAAAQLIEDRFEEQLEALEADPARAISDATIERVLGPTEAQIVDEGQKLLVEGSIPLRAEDEAGELKKVDLNLEASEGELSPVNPLVEVSIPARAGEGVEIGSSGFAVTPPTSELGAESAAQRFGEKDVLYPETQTDTDTFVAPVGEGAELFSLLRSAQSPSELRFHLDLLAGSELREDGHGGAEVVQEGNILARVLIPHATDAQGAEVPVTMSVEGQNLVLAVDRGEDQFAYPILVDPWVDVSENWYDAGNSWYYDSANLAALGYWNFGATAARFSGATAWQSPFPQVGASERGLFIHANSTTGSQPANSYGQWTYTAPGEDTFFTAALIKPFWIYANGCGQGTYPEPHDYSGFWSSTWGWGTFNRDQARVYGYGINTAPGEEDWHHGIGHILTIGLGTEATNTAPPLPCPRDLFAGGVEFWMADWYAPTLTKVEGTFPTGWIKKDTTARTINASATDSGLGVQTVKLIGTGTGAGFNWNHPTCKGTSEDPCPASQSGTITYETIGFPFEGEEKVVVKALDPTGKGVVGEEHLLKIDGRSPLVKREGQLAEVAGEDLSLPTYKIKATATDGTTAEPNSGVKEIGFYLDEAETPLDSKSQSCATGNCEMSFEYTLRLEELAPGHHTLHTVAEDMVGNKAEADVIGFDYVPPTGMKDEFLLQHIPLPDGEDHSGEAEPHGPEIAVNVATGNLVYHQRDVHAPTAHAGLDLERSYNSQQPEAQDGQWGRGWSLVQAPELTQSAAEAANHEATLVGTTAGAVTGSVPAPASEGSEALAATLHATVRKAGSGYEVGYESKEETQVFGSSGKIEETVVGAVEAPSEPNLSSTPTYISSFGTAGTGNGQFAHPAGIAIDAEGSLWVIDENNNRVEKFNSAGEYQLKFGSLGTGNGQFNRPTALALDPEGNVWVVDAGNHRVQEFNAKGEFIQKFGTAGSGNGQLSTAEGIAIDPAGDVFVADTYNARIEEFNAKGEFLATIGTKGSGAGQLIEPTDVALGKAGSLWVADWANNKVVEFDANGAYVRQFGSSGTGNGQFAHPDVLTVDLMGDVWVGDQNNARVQRFSEEGTYRAKFGAKGSGAGQFSFGYPMGIEVDQNGKIWVADTANNRVQNWTIPGFDPSYGAPETAPPAIEFDYSGKTLVEMSLDEVGSEEDVALQLTNSGAGQATEAAGEGEVDGEALGDSKYVYENGNLISAEDEEGRKTTYGYDAGHRLTAIKLPNGTTATMEYDSLDRATLVTVDPAGSEGPKTTHFFYKDQPRETTVWGVEPEAVFQIGARGGVFHWQNVAKPPTLKPLSGSLVKYLNKAEAIPVETDETLTVVGEDNEAVSSMRVVLNGNSVAAERTCEDTVPPSGKCKQPEALTWVMNPSELSAGRVDAEAVVTDNEGKSTAERFFLTIPQQPPPDPSAPEKPDFKSVKLFREEYGLDREHSYTEAQLTKLILETLYEWESQQPVAVQAVEEWGVPMRAPELAELAYRQSYVDQFSEIIQEWADEHAPATYGGYFVDNRAGGIIHVGFTKEQAEQVALVRHIPGLMAPEQQIQGFPSPPSVALSTAKTTEGQVVEAIAGDPGIQADVSAILIPPGQAVVQIQATDVPAVQSFVTGHFGVNPGISVIPTELQITPAYTRWSKTGPVYAGQGLYGVDECESGGGVCESACTAGFGARRQTGQEHGHATYAYYALTAGHCFTFGTKVGRTNHKGFGQVPANIGEVAIDSWPKVRGVLTDSEAVHIAEERRSDEIFWGDPRYLLKVKGVARPRMNMHLCWSGINGGVNCGHAFEVVWNDTDKFGRKDRIIGVDGPVVSGDSGGPVWNPETEKAVGLITNSAGYAGGPNCRKIPTGERWCPVMFFTPLLPFKDATNPLGISYVLDIEVLREK